MSDELRFEKAQNIAKETAGQIEKQSANKMINEGCRVVLCSAGVFDNLLQLADIAFKD
ncbi:hypothetical protein OAI29_08530 [Amylibacter sp.]|nr:hypothetical protein [Amylibacter sp.]|tara:strand:+ start:206 stop:379 length:174 start_codon:yes stop_codon:yes gene_type:complete